MAERSTLFEMPGVQFTALHGDQVAALALSSDDLSLAVALGEEVHVYSVPALSRGGQVCGERGGVGYSQRSNLSSNVGKLCGGVLGMVYAFTHSRQALYARQEMGLVVGIWYMRRQVADTHSVGWMYMRRQVADTHSVGWMHVSCYANECFLTPFSGISEAQAGVEDRGACAVVEPYGSEQATDGGL